ncbi:similar to Saccharomyces cerevisiae YDR194C MSS116 DEAD-box protein required for efficient splicing of mitochondrial Group I and II introns [Maudiozyma barnettii]|uniref:ATP-dependent RNA helicase n=1 Tax=Maudiozyma barnettii TaxID=61262 RepID=A0A8H2ZFW9_9SACH|nr:ATP-dependent RNA helicase [Kazachstania barnettii]CAB4253929.1 similar to Saccharomyces cerevisiae YDR194C MSS116 DEAD-box protein required for efficient splicing of mitochondrial Group I and II introns [Kazachstania barnettii]CAD1781679.1 similar to Saccharomyces cerevisiae YDR194C MSS116 DEAD-box protein required for efficient splicing of mitochondrial Group I and II introns [Kazachstania barnettii]
MLRLSRLPIQVLGRTRSTPTVLPRLLASAQSSFLCFDKSFHTNVVAQSGMDRSFGRSNDRGGGRTGGYNFNNTSGARYNRNRRDGFNNNRKQFRKPVRRDEDEVHFDEATMAKLIHVPKDAAAEEVTLDQMLEEKLLDNTLHKSISRMGFDGLTPVQQKTIKPIVQDEENDVIARAKTGTGKTFAFLIPIFQHLINTDRDSQYMVKAVIVAPTRDLALQIESEVKKIHKHNYGLKKFEAVALVGGTNFDSAMRRMNKLRPNIVIATPGRLLDVLSKQGDKFFKYVDFKVLDEADRLLEIGFKEDLEEISNTLNGLNGKGRDHIRTLLFSATLDEKVQRLSNSIMNKESCLFIDTVDKNEPEAHEKIDQSLVISDKFSDNIYAAIQHIKSQLELSPGYKAILFTPTVKFTKFISHILRKEIGRELPILEFHGKIEQRRRTNLVREFKELKKGILICTDVGARGMDFPNVAEVLQIGVPSELSNYIHRIGRTARSGKEGKSTIFLCKDELPFIETLEERKNIIIKNKLDYKTNEGISKEFASKIDDPYELSDTLLSLISFYRSVIKEYGFDTRKILPQLAASYGELLNDPEEKISIGRHQLERLGLSNNPVAQKMFNIASSRRFNNDDNDYEPERNRNSRNRNYDNDNNYQQNRYSNNNSRGQRFNRFGN